MRYARLGNGTVELADAPSPRAGAGELVVRLAAGGVCGTDVEKLRGGYRASSTLGHESVGAIAQVGEGVSGHAVGDRVFVHHHVPCGTCAICARGEFTFCPTYQKTNLDPGGFAEEFRVSETHVRAGAVLPLDRSISWEEGTLLEPGGCVVTALRRVGFGPGRSVFIFGLGPVGLLYARIARALGASWVGGAEISELRRKVAVRGGIDEAVDPRDADALSAAVARAPGGAGVDLSVVATGAPAAVAGALRIARRAGTLNLFGLPAMGSRLDIDLQELYLRGLRVIPTYATTEPDIREVQRLRVEGTLPLADLVTDRFPLAEVAAAFERAKDAAATVKVVVTGPAYGGGASATT